jgi:hypothetical protein
MHPKTLMPLIVAAFAVAMTPGCARKQEVSYKKDVAPILDKHCAKCHMEGEPGYLASGFNMQGYDALMKGTRYGPVVLPGDPMTSVLVMLIEGRADPSIKMPHGDEPPLTKDEIKTIRRWV